MENDDALEKCPECGSMLLKVTDGWLLVRDFLFQMLVDLGQTRCEGGQGQGCPFDSHFKIGDRMYFQQGRGESRYLCKRCAKLAGLL